MDNASSHQAGMEGGRVFTCSQSGFGSSKLPAMDMSNSHPGDYSGIEVFIPGAKLSNDNLRLKKIPEPRVAGGHVHSSNAMDMSDSHDVDCSDMHVFIPGATLSNDNLRLKKMPEPRVADVSVHCSNALDIDKKLATKKVVPPAEIKDETASVLDLSLNIQHKERPQKRTISQAVYEPHASYAISPETLKVTENAIQLINGGNANELEISLNFNRQYLSNISNLTPVHGIQVTSGTFGDVLKVRDSQTGRILTQKKVKKNAQGKFYIEKNEIQVPLQFADVENIAKFLGLYKKGDTLLFIMEDAGISLRQLITDREGCRMLLESGIIEKIMLDVYTAIYHLASHNITHCDIKPENVCVNTKTWVAKLIDFGSCKTSQNSVNYKGITPEYLDPVANKYLRQVYELQKMPQPAHRLDENDDVFAVGLVGLFLLMKVHPLIHFFTGRDMVEDINTRLNIMKKISELTEEQMSLLLDVPMSDVMRVLLRGVLALDRDKRWKAREAVSFLQEKLGSDVQPPHKLLRPEPQPRSSQAEDLSRFVNLHKKDLDKVVAQKIQKCESPGSPEIMQSQGLGVMLKGPAASTQTGGILLPAKYFLQQKMISPLDSQPQCLGQIRRRHAAEASTQPGGILLPAKLFLQQKMISPLDPQPQHLGQTRQRHAAESMLNEEENREYNDLVMSFSNKTQVGQGRLPAQQMQRCADLQQQQHDLQKVRVLPVSAGSSQGMRLPHPPAGQPMSDNLGAVQEDQPATGQILGLSGNHLFQFAGRSHLNTSSEVHGNIPNIEDLIQTSEEPCRPKLRGRRSHGSQDEK